MLAEEHDGFVDPRLAELRDDESQARECAGDFIEEIRPRELELALFGELADRMHEDRHAELLSLGVDVHRAAVGNALE